MKEPNSQWFQFLEAAAAKQTQTRAPNKSDESGIRTHALSDQISHTSKVYLSLTP